jgi:polar amino acid transport system permease protein
LIAALPKAARDAVRATDTSSMTYTFQFGQLLPYADQFPVGLWLTIVLGVQAMVFSLVVGVIGAAARTQPVRAIRAIVAIYVEVVRNNPVLVQIYLVFFALLWFGLRLSPNTAAVVALTIKLAKSRHAAHRTAWVTHPKEAVDRA